MIRAKIIMIKCHASQCKKKQWCKRYHLYNDRHINDTTLQQVQEYTSNLYVDDWYIANLNIATDQCFDLCEYFIPTEQYLIKEELKELINKLNKLG